MYEVLRRSLDPGRDLRSTRVLLAKFRADKGIFELTECSAILSCRCLESRDIPRRSGAVDWLSDENGRTVRKGEKPPLKSRKAYLPATCASEVGMETLRVRVVALADATNDFADWASSIRYSGVAQNGR